MRGKSRWTWGLAVCLVLGWATASHAVPQDRAELVAAYNAIFTDVVVAEPTGPLPVEPRGNIHCCAASGACVQTTAAKCTKAVPDGYGGTVYETHLACTQAGCT